MGVPGRNLNPSGGVGHGRQGRCGTQKKNQSTEKGLDVRNERGTSRRTQAPSLLALKKKIR